MHSRTLGDSGVEVSEVGFGAWVVGTDWWGDKTEVQSVEMVQHALSEGITFFDTGDVYGHGRSEELIGQALSEHRDEVTIGTKIGYDFYNHAQAGHGEIPKNLDPDWMRECVEKSIERLGVEHIDFLQLHNANVAEVTPEVMNVLSDLRDEGRVDALGWALGPSIGWLAEGDRAVELDFDAIQTVYNMFEQVPGQHFIDTIRRENADTSIIARVPHSSGLLNEQVRPETELKSGDHRGFRPDAWYETGWEKLETVRFLEHKEEQSSSGSRTASKKDGARTMAQAAIQWLLSHDEVASVTPTFHSTDDITEWAAATETPPLSADEQARVAALYETNFKIDRNDGMDSLRSSVDGEDIDAAGLKLKNAGA